MSDTDAHTPGPWTFDPGGTPYDEDDFRYDEQGRLAFPPGVTEPMVYVRRPDPNPDGERVVLATLHRPFYDEDVVENPGLADADENHPGFAEIAYGDLAANGRLMAAAPDLLAALKDCCAALGGVKRNPEKIPMSARLAIAKAEGL